MKRQSHQRITKIKRDKIEELLKQAESISVEDGTVVQPQGADLTPYPDMDRLRLWTNSYLLPGVNKIYPTKIDNQGTMYLTAIVDGLPLHTKMTKTIEGTSTETIVTGKQINSNILTINGSSTFSEATGVASGFSVSNYYTVKPEYVIPGTEFCICIIVGDTSISDLKYIIGSNAMLQIYQEGSKISTWDDNGGTNEKVIVNNVATGQEVYVKTQYIDSNHVTVKYSFDGSNYTTVYENFNSPRTWTDDNKSYWIGRAPWGAERYFRGSIDFSKSYVRLSSGLPEYLATDTAEPITLTSETSKPGLWLSNFIYPVYGDNSGSYLQHNKVHSNEGVFNKFNSDIIGNYSYSFIQRGKFTKYSEANWDNGCDTTYWQFTPNNYNIHYSPNIHSCMAYPSLQISNPKFGQIYTTYQTIVTPSDPDMQKYQEADHKCITFDNREYSNSESVTKYAARLVGKDWSYELTFNGNGFGSGNDYGNGGNPDNDNGSNGGCVTGTITYVDSILGTTCTQEINSCFQTAQSYFNPNVPDLDVPPLQDPDRYEEAHSTGCGNIEHVNSETEYNVCGSNFSYPALGSRGLYLYGCAKSIWGYCSTEWRPIWDKELSNWNAIYCNGKLTRDLSTDNAGGNSGSYYTAFAGMVSSTRKVSVTLVKEITPVDEPQTKVNIYMNIHDLKAEAEALGLPWTGGCGEARFTVDFSTKKCEDIGCTSRLIASNVDINSLGDISRLNNITITG